MRPFRIILALLALAALALAGCTSGSGTHPAAAPAQPAQVATSTTSTTRPITTTTTRTTATPTTTPRPPRSPRPFPGIWDITTWQQAREVQEAVDNGHQPWRCGPDQLVSLYAQEVLHVVRPVLRRIDPSTFEVTESGRRMIATVKVTQPIKRDGNCDIWVITGATRS